MNIRKKDISVNRNHAGAWAAVIARVDGGFLTFESVSDYTTWEGQK